jgi:iron complex transport system permease protein
MMGLFISLIVSVLVALTIGVYQISIIDVFSTILYHIIPIDDLSNFNSLYNTIVWNIRFPRIILSVGVGISLAAAGGIYQGCFRNPLVEPYILGVESGAAFGAAMAIVIPTFFLSLQVSAFIFGGIAVFSAYLLARVRGETPVIMLILSGVIIGSIFTAFVSILKYVATDAALREIVFWLMGGFYYASWSDVFLVIPIILISFLLVWLLSWKLNILSMGDEEAKTLGVNPEWYKAFFIILATLMTALSVSVVGVIAWVGLMMPHAARMIIGPDHRFMLPTAAMMGGIYLILCDTIARTLTSAEIPVGILTSIIGAPYLLYLIRNKGKLTFGVD